MAVLYATITAPLLTGDTLTVTAGSAPNTQERTLTLLRLPGGASLDATGSSATALGENPQVSTATPLGAGAGLVVAATATGVCVGATYTNDPAYTQAFTFTGSCSSGLVAYRLSSTLSGIQVFAPTASDGNAANCIAAFR